MTGEPDREEILDLIVKWEEAQAQGRPLAPEELCRECPHLLSGFRRQVEKLEEVDWLDAPLIESAFSPTPAARSFPAAVDLDQRRLADRYDLVSLVGEGGFGRVYKGFDTWLERHVAIKVPRLESSVSFGETDQCRVEARKVARLRHPNIVPVHDVGREGTFCFIVGEWIEGTNLAIRLKGEPVGPDTAARIVAEIAEALEHAHRAGFVHRDIKPANILIDLKGKAYLTDFGIAAVEADIPRHRDAAGTLPYMAPEQLTEAHGPVDHRADLFALGVVCFELLTGRRPFVARNAAQLREQILDEEWTPGAVLLETVPESLRRICLRALSKRPAERYQTAAELAAELRGWSLASGPRSEPMPPAD